MATYQSIFKINGQLGDYVFYKLNGKTVVRRKAKKRKGAKSTAQNNNEKKNTEFAEVMKAGKHFRNALEEEYLDINDGLLYQRLNSLFLNIKNCDTAEEGCRTLAGGLDTAEGKKLLAKFRFPKKRKSYPEICRFSVNGTKVSFEFNRTIAKAFTITELQIDLENGKFRKFEHSVTASDEKGHFCIRKQFRKKKGFTEFYLLKDEILVMMVCGG